MSRTMRPSILAVAIAVIAAACGGAAEPSALAELELAEMDTYGCGHGFWLGTADQEVAIQLAAADPQAVVDGELPTEASLPDDAWRGTVQQGRDLFANWCDDVVEPGEATPEVVEEWTITGGMIRVDGPVDQDCPAAVTATVADLEATAADGTTVALGSREITNDSWGCFAG